MSLGTRLAATGPARKPKPQPDRVQEDRGPTSGMLPGPAWEQVAHTAVTAITVLSLFGVSFATWATVVQVPITGAISMVGFAGGLVLLIAAFVITPSRLARVDLAVLVLGLTLLLGWAISTIYIQPGYGTDEAAFEQFAASLLLHGHNPYAANLTPALNEFRVPVQYATYLLGGGIVHTLGYPALPVLVVAVFVELTGGVQSVIIADVLALGATCLVTYMLLPRPWKSVAVLVTIGLPILFGYSVSGVNAILVGLPLVVVAWRWTDTGRGGHLGRAGIARAACLGLAVSTQQLAWFVAPFVLIGVWRLRRADLTHQQALRVLAAFTGWMLAVFMAINLPFIAWDPGVWLSGVMSTLTQHAIPYGQGLVDLSLFFRVGGGALVFYTLAGVLVYLAILACYTARTDRLGRACFVLPVVALFITTRSLAEYFMVLVAVWAVSLLTTQPGSFASLPRLWVRRHSSERLKLVALFTPALAALVVALAVPAPLSLSVLSVTTNGELEGVWQLRVAVANKAKYSISPQFQANYLGQPSTFFHQVSGPLALAPGHRAVYTLTAPNRGSMPGIVAPFVVVATTANPQTVSVSRRFIPQPYSADLEPGYVNEIVSRHGSVAFHVYLRSPFGGLVHKGGVRVALGQVIYGQESLIDAEASINARPEGQSPVYAYTGSNGIATFLVTDPQPQDEPLYFQAWIDSSYPFGYSDIVPVLWQG